VNEKKCTKCSLTLPETKEFFYRQKTTKSGFRASCKKCCDKKAMKYYNNNKEKIVEVQKQWQKTNRQHINEYNKNRRADLSPEELEVQREKEREQVLKWKSKCTSGVYVIRCIPNSKVYIGESYAIENRWISHRSALKQESKCNPELLNDWKTYGEQAFEFKIIKELTSSTKEVRLLEEEKAILDLKLQGVVVYNSTKDRRRING